MAVYTVHQPLPRSGEATADPMRFAFVRDGFHFWAFLLGPIWMLWHRLWLVLVLYLIATTAVQVALWMLGVSAAVKFAVGFLIAILVGCEAGSLRRWTLRRWRDAGVVVGRNRDEAERRFFESFEAGAVTAPPRASSSVSAVRTPVAPPQRDIIGLFPEAEPRR